VQVLIVPLA